MASQRHTKHHPQRNRGSSAERAGGLPQLTQLCNGRDPKPPPPRRCPAPSAGEAGRLQISSFHLTPRTTHCQPQTNRTAPLLPVTPKIHTLRHAKGGAAGSSPKPPAGPEGRPSRRDLDPLPPAASALGGANLAFAAQLGVRLECCPSLCSRCQRRGRAEPQHPPLPPLAGLLSAAAAFVLAARCGHRARDTAGCPAVPPRRRDRRARATRGGAWSKDRAGRAARNGPGSAMGAEPELLTGREQHRGRLSYRLRTAGGSGQRHCRRPRTRVGSWVMAQRALGWARGRGRGKQPRPCDAASAPGLVR